MSEPDEPDEPDDPLVLLEPPVPDPLNVPESVVGAPGPVVLCGAGATSVG